MSRSHRAVRAAVAALCVLSGASVATAADSWLEVTSPHFTVISNAGEKKARNVAWQFEQIRGAIEKGWPWARVDLALPITVFAVKDESSMKALAPYYWEKGHDDIHPASVFTSAGDRHYIALRADVEGEDREGLNPYRQSYWSYTELLLQSSFSRALPLWFVRGLSAVLSNSIVRPTEIQFGRPIPYYVRVMQQESRLRLADLFGITYQSDYRKQQPNATRFDAECWTLLQYLIFAESEDATQHLSALSKLLLNGMRSDQAVAQVYGSVDRVEQKYFQYLKSGFMKYGRLQVESDVSAQKYPVRTLSAAESAADRAGFHVATDRLAEARALLTEAKAADAALPRAFEVEAAAFEREQKTTDARAAYAKATDLGSTNFYPYYRLAATSNWRNGPDTATLAAAQTQLARAIELNERFPGAHALRASILLQANNRDDALKEAVHAVELEPSSASHRLTLAAVLTRMSRFDDARTSAQLASEVARSDAERQAAQNLLTLIAQQQQKR